jgi:hypothetical protein
MVWHWCGCCSRGSGGDQFELAKKTYFVEPAPALDDLVA